MYCDIDDIKTYLGITEDTDDVLLAQMIAAAQAAIDTYCRRTFEATEDETRYFDAVADVDGADLLMASAGDLASITSVTNGDSALLAGTDYVTQPRRQGAEPIWAIRLLSSSGVTWTYTTDHEGAIAIVGRWAYSTTVKDDIAQACKILATWLYRQKDTTSDTDRPLLAGDGTIVMPNRLPSVVNSLLKPYRKYT